MSINTNNVNSSRLEKAFETIFDKAIDLGLIPPDAVLSCSFVSAEEIHELNKVYRGIDRPTDVLSFAMQEGDDFESMPDFEEQEDKESEPETDKEVLEQEREQEKEETEKEEPNSFETQSPGIPEIDLGDIFINTQAIEDQARDYGHSPFREACFLFAHGLLHLAGYDHQTPQQEEEMRKWQRELLLDVASRQV